MPTPEQLARQEIDRQLTACGWIVHDRASVNLSAGRGVSAHEGLPFVYESTGVETFFRDRRDPEPLSRRVFSFHRPETLAAWFAEPDTLRGRLARLPADHPLATAGLRACQIEAV